MRYVLLLLALGTWSGLWGQITQVEYFLDTDPGFGNGTPLEFIASDDGTIVTTTLPLNDVSAGFHTLYVRAKEADGAWSLTTRRDFYYQQTPSKSQSIAEMEYFIDTDPGFGKGAQVTLTQDSTELPLNITLDQLEALAPGFHILYVRAKDRKDDWPITTRRGFYLEEGDGGLANITRLEYYYYHVNDNAIAGDSLYTYNFANPATTIDTTFAATVEPLTNGQNYVLYVWAYDESNGRSLLVSTNQFTYNEAAPIAITTEVKNILCAGDTAGSITVNTTRGEGTLVYSISMDSANFSANRFF